jgi:hypothetical protein
MGYYTRVDGEITIAPWLTQSEMELAGLAPREYYPKDRWIVVTSRYYRDDPLEIAVRVEVNELIVPEGKFTTVTGVALIQSWDDASKAYYIEEDLRTMVNTFPEHSFTGELRMQGEDNLDIWKLAIHNEHDVIVLRPKLVWPDGTEETYT